jgi:hypothetical protein
MNYELLFKTNPTCRGVLSGVACSSAIASATAEAKSEALAKADSNVTLQKWVIARISYLCRGCFANKI